MRAFLAVDVDGRTLDAAAAIVERLRGGGDRASAFARTRVRWVARDVMHVTLRFFGEIDAARAAALGELVAQLGAREAGPIPIASASLVAFPDARGARVLALDLVEPTGAIAAMAREAEAAAAAMGLEPEARAHRPHLTLARMREPADLRAVLSEGAAAELPADARAIGVTLYESVLGAGGPTYTALTRASFGTN